MALSLRSPLLTAHGFRHGFSLRGGGVSSGPYASLNLGGHVGDEPAAVRENQRRFASEVGYDPARLYEVRQVHGARVERVHAELDPAAVYEREADALISAECAIAVKVADCAAILLADPETGAVAAAHAGWRGIVQKVIACTVEALGTQLGARPERLLAAVFPCIGSAAFEVGEDVAEQIAQAVGDRSVLCVGAGRPHVELARSAALQLAQAGLVSARVDLVEGCTFGDSARFFSFRREGGVTGRHLAAIRAGC